MTQTRTRRRWIKRLTVAALAAAALPAVALGVTIWRLPPLDEAAIRQRSVTVLDRHDQVLRAFTVADGRWRIGATVQDVDPRYIRMLLAYEDKRFRSHFGIDPLALMRAGGQMIRNRRVISGGSTLTMQVARLMEPRPERTLAAKWQQMARAVDLERRYSKDEILGLYLSLAPFGGNLEGVRAASFAYFGKDARRLSNGEAAALVMLPQSPELRRPDRRNEAAIRGRERVFETGLRAGVIPPQEIAGARREAMPQARQSFPMLAAHVAEDRRQELPNETFHRLTIDRNWQAALEQLARERLQGMDSRLSVAIVVVEHATGAVRAAVSGDDYFAEDRAGAMDLTQALRSPGSALKPFIYAAAFDDGLAHPATTMEDRPSRFGLYAPENFDQTFQGTVSARLALQHSLNIPAVDLLSAVGPQRFVSRLKRAGAELALPPEGAPGLAIGLGGVGVTLRDLTRLYAGLAADGQAMPLLIDRDRPPAGEPSQITGPVAAWYVADTLLGAPPPVHAQGGRIAYKTGTSYGYRDAWSVGFDRSHAIGVWVGRADNGPVPGLIGRAVAAPILFDAFQRIGINPGVQRRPVDAIVAQQPSELPLPLRHLRRDLPKTQTAIVSSALKVAFPPDGAKIELQGSTPEDEPLAVKILGGTPPFTVWLNGKPVAAESQRRQLLLTPDGLGFSRITIADGAGQTDTVTIKLEAR
jgi:penicillin-binding protein 1C